MSHITLGREGMKHFDQSEWDDAILKLTKALKGSPKAVEWLLTRSTAYIRVKQFEKSYRDANRALLAATERGKRGQMLQAQHCRAVALNRLGRVADAIACSTWAADLALGKPAGAPDEETSRVDADGNYVPEDITVASEWPKDRAEFAKDGRRTVTLRTMMINTLKSLPTDDPNRKVRVPKKPEPEPDEVEVEETPEPIDLDASDEEIEEPPKTEEERKARKVAAAKKKFEKEARDLRPPEWMDYYSKQFRRHSRVATYDSDDDYDHTSLLQDLTRLGKEYWSKKKPRYEWIESSEKATLSIYTKGALDGSPIIKVSRKKVSLYNLPDLKVGSWAFSIDLAHPIHQKRTAWKIGQPKIEITLVKREPGKWKTLEAEGGRGGYLEMWPYFETDESGNKTISRPSPSRLDEMDHLPPTEPSTKSYSTITEFELQAGDVLIPTPSKVNTTSQLPKEEQDQAFDLGPDLEISVPVTSKPELAAAAETTKSDKKPATASSPTETKSAGPPSYPTSSKTGPKNWDTLDVDDDDDLDKNDPNYFFKMMYKNSSPDVQRAMIKSFTESNGTALSTDWNDVKSRTFETKPPEGVEAKQWDDKPGSSK